MSQILDGSPVPTFVINQNHKIIFWNRAWKTVQNQGRKGTGNSRAQTRLLWRSGRNSGRSDCSQGLDGRVEKFYGDSLQPSELLKESYECERFIPSLGPNGKWLFLMAGPLRDMQGRLYGAIETFQDITKNKADQQVLQTTLTTLQTLLEKVPFGLVLVDKKKIIRKANKAALTVLGKTESQVIGRPCNRILCPSNRKRCPVWEEKRVLEGDKLQLPGADDQPITILKNSFPVRLEGEEMLLEAFIDITEMERAEQRVRQESAKLSSMISGMQEGVVFADAADTIVEANPYFLDLVGRKREDLIGKKLTQVHSLETQAKVQKLLRQFRENPDSCPLCFEREFLGRIMDLRVQPIYSDSRA